MAKIKWLSRLVYWLVGLSGIYALIFMVMSWSVFVEMGILNILAYILVMIGAINWLIVGIAGDRNKDLFGLLKL